MCVKFGGFSGFVGAAYMVLSDHVLYEVLKRGR
jgi:hypothetical protein